MSWSYDATNLENHLNWVRARIGDTDTNDQQLSDEELNSLLALQDDKTLAALSAARMIAAKYTRYGAQAEAKIFHELAAQIAMEAGPQYLC